MTAGETATNFHMNTAELIAEPAQEPQAPAQILEIVESSGIASESALVLKSQLAPFFIQAQEWQSKLSTITDAKGARESRLTLRKVRTDAEHKKDALKKGALAYTNAVDACFRLIKATVEPMEEQLLEIEKAAERAEALRKTKVRDERAAQLMAVGFDPSFTALSDIPEEAFQALLKQQTDAHEIRLAAKRKADEDARIAAEKAEADRIAKEQAEAAERESIRLENERLKREAAEREEAARIERERIAKEKADAEAKAESDRRAAEEAARVEWSRRTAIHNARAAIIRPYLTLVPCSLEYADMTDERFNEVLADRKAQFEERARLAKEAEEKEAAAAEERRKAKEAADLAAEQARKEREEIERKAKEASDAAALVAKREREAREKAEAELRAANEAKAAKEKADIEAAERAVAAPDKEKLLAFAETIRGIFLPEMATEKGKALMKGHAAMLESMANAIMREAGEL